MLWLLSMMPKRKSTSVFMPEELTVVSSLVASAQICIRSRSCTATSLTRLFDMKMNDATSTSEMMTNAVFQMRRRS